MFASQLLRILQTIPSDAKKYDSRESVFDLDQSDAAMKETQNVMKGDSRSLRRESSDNIAFGSKEIYRFDSSGRRTNPFLYESKGRDYDWNPRFANEFSTENDDRESKFMRKSNDRKGKFPQEKDETHVRERTSRASKNKIPIIEVEEFKHREGNESIDSWLRTLSSETNGKGKAKIDPENDKASVEESRDRWSSSSSSSLSSETNSPDRNISVQVVEFKRREDAAASSGIFERDAYLFGEKDTLECDIPELLVCYKEINYHIMGENFSIYGDDDDDNSHSKSTEKGTDLEASASDEMAFSSSESADCSGRKEEKGGDLIVNMQSGSLFEDGNDEPDLSVKEELNITGEDNSVSTGERADKQQPLEDVSLVDQKLPIQEFGTRSFLRSFLHSLDDRQTSKDIQLHDQHMSPRKEAADDRADLSAKEEPKENGETNSLCYESEVENGSITFKFSSSSPVTTAHILNQISDRHNDVSLDSESMLTPKDSEGKNNYNPPHRNQVQCERDATVANQELSIKTNVETDLHQPFEPKNKNIDDQSQLSKTQDQESMTSLDAEAVETSLRQHEPRKSSCQESVLSNNTHTELSAKGLITYSGTIEHNGSQSIRSDGSATSTRSFAFPILQCEWDDSSPARMGYKADGRHLRKHKNSRSGLFCCGF